MPSNFLYLLCIFSSSNVLFVWPTALTWSSARSHLALVCGRSNSFSHQKPRRWWWPFGVQQRVEYALQRTGLVEDPDLRHMISVGASASLWGVVGLS